MLPPGEVLQRRPSIQDKLQHVVCIFLSNVKSNVQFNLEKFFFLDKPLLLSSFSKCTAVSRLAEVLCEQNRCLQEQSLIDEVNSMSSFDWRARNYSEFWGKKLSEGVQLRLGTLNPSNSVSEYNIIIRFLRSFERACFQTDRKQRFTE